MVGSLLIAASAGNVTLIVVGALFAGVGCLPVAAAGHWTLLARNTESRRDARERKVLEIAQQYLTRATEVTRLPRKERLAVLDDVVKEVPLLLCRDVYQNMHSVRAVVFGVANSGELHVLSQAGRSDAAKAFDAASGRLGSLREFLAGPNNHLFVTNLHERTYSSFVSVPIRSATVVYGMLTIDALNAADLDESDGYVVEVLASALCLFFAEAIRGMHK
jgi:hypothetical protein